MEKRVNGSLGLPTEFGQPPFLPSLRKSSRPRSLNRMSLDMIYENLYRHGEVLQKKREQKQQVAWKKEEKEFDLERV